MNILSYNFYCRPKKIFYDEQVQRAYKLKNVLENKNYDIIMFQELFDNSAYKIVKKTMRHLGYRYKTKRVGKKFDIFRMNGGCKIFSKHRILEQDMLLFNPGHIFNIMSSKGANYCKIQKDDKIIHCVNVHLDSFDKKIRKEQMLDIKIWLNKKKIPNDEMIVIGGDFNIDYYVKEINNVEKVFGKEYKLNKHEYHEKDCWRNYSTYNQNDWAIRRDKNKDEINELLDFFVIKNPNNLNISQTKSVRFVDEIYANKIKFSTPFYFNIYNLFKSKKTLNDMSDHYGVSIQIQC